MPETNQRTQTIAALSATPPPAVPIVLTVLLATVIRMTLVFQGQYFFPDEDRYERSLDFWEAVSEFEPAKAVTAVYKAKGRPGAVVTYLPAALIQWSANRLFDLQPIQTSWIPAAFTALLAGLNTILLWWLAIKLFGPGPASTIAAILYGLVAPGLYYVQFLLPYIAAQTYFLACLNVLPGRDESKRGRRLLCSGVLFGCGLATYPGLYDQAVVVAIVAVALVGSFSIRRWARLLWVPVGVVAVLLIWELCSWLGWGPHYFESLKTLQSTIVQGAFGEAWRLPAEFLWTADPLLSVLLLAGLGVAIYRVCTAFRDHKACALLLLAVLLWYGFRLLLGALEREVLYGRLVFQILPTLCLIAGVGWAGVLRQLAQRRRVLVGASLALCCWAIWNVWPFLQVTVPDQFEWRALQDKPEYRIVAYVTSIAGTGMMDPNFEELDKRLARLNHTRPQADKPVVLANTHAIYPVSGFREPDDLRIIEQARHPLNIPALQFEAWSPQERAVLRSRELRVMLIEPPPASELRGWLQRWGGFKMQESERE